MSEAVDDTVGTDWRRFWSDHEKMVELISRDSIGPEYYEIVSDVKKIEECLYNPDLRFRLLALQLCGNRWNPGPEAKLRIMELAKQDPSEIVLHRGDRTDWHAVNELLDSGDRDQTPIKVLRHNGSRRG